MKATKCLTLSLAAVLLVQQGAAAQCPAPKGTAFTYQGLLTCTPGAPAPAMLVDGTCDFVFDLYDCQTGGALIATALTVRDLNDPNKPLCAPAPKCPVMVIDGHFSVQLEFGNVYAGNARFLEITVGCPTPCQPAQATLAPRSELTPVPYALFAQKGAGPVDDKDWSGSGSGVMWTTNLKDKVGIGTDTPIGKLDVVGNTLGNVFVYNHAQPTRTYEIRAGGRQEIYNTNDFVHFSGSNVAFVVGAPGGGINDDFFISVGNTAPANIKFFLDGTSGNVGIGTTTPDARLHVDKDIRVAGAELGSAARVRFRNVGGSIGTYGLSVESDLLADKGAQVGVLAKTSVDPVNHPQKGAAEGRLATVHGFSGQGRIRGVVGISTPNVLSNFDASRTSEGLGGYFIAKPDDTLTLNSTGTYWVGGVYAEVGETINVTPTLGAVAAIIGVDRNNDGIGIDGTAQSFAGYFDGKVLVTDLPTGGIALVSADAAGVLHRNPGSITLGAEIQGSTDTITASSGTINFDDEDLVTKGSVFVTGSGAQKNRTYEIRAGGRQEIYNRNDFVHFSGSNAAFVLNADEFGGGGNDNFFISVGSTAPANIKFFLDGTSGNVGIGTDNPQEKLHVCGNIRAEGSITASGVITPVVSGSCPDYVFERDYPLLSLDELERYIQQEKHLPNIPSAAEVEREGINLGEFQMRVLEKVEELVLYTLRQHKTITRQNQTIDKQAAGIADLSERLARMEALMTNLTIAKKGAER